MADQGPLFRGAPGGGDGDQPQTLEGEVLRCEAILDEAVEVFPTEPVIPMHRSKGLFLIWMAL